MTPAQAAFAAAVLLNAPAASFAQDVDPAQYEHLKEPRITERPDERMLEVRATGDPTEMGGQAFGLLFQLYFSSGAAAGFTPPIPRARWPEDLTTPQSQWLGRYALPVPETVQTVPEHTAPDSISASITTWEYGEIGEILHVGPYDAEQPTIERLRAFLEAQGYETVGGHEEEYIRGPTMAGPGNPDEYLTILRYRVRRRAGSGRADEAIVAHVRAARDASNAAFAARDVDRIASFWTENVSITAGSGTAAIGRNVWREAIAAQFERYPDVLYVRMPDAVNVSDVAPLASEHGTWRGSWSTENGPVVSAGDYQAMWRRGPEGWRLRSQLFVTLSCEGSGCGATRTP